MAYEQKANTGTIFKNDKKADNHPDYRGQINVNGKLLDIALWVKNGQKGQFFSASISEPRPKTEGAKTYTPKNAISENNMNDMLNDGLPF